MLVKFKVRSYTASVQIPCSISTSWVPIDHSWPERLSSKHIPSSFSGVYPFPPNISSLVFRDFSLPTLNISSLVFQGFFPSPPSPTSPQPYNVNCCFICFCILLRFLPVSHMNNDLYWLLGPMETNQREQHVKMTLGKCQGGWQKLDRTAETRG